VCLYVLQYILNSGKKATIRTKPHNAPMLRVMEKLGFTPLE